MERVLKDKKAICIFVLPAIFIYGYIVLFSIGKSVSYTFYNGIPGLDFEFSGLENYKSMLMDPVFWQTIRTNLKYVSFVVSGQVGLGLLVSLFLMFGIKKYKNLVRTIIFFPVVLPSVATSQLFVKVFEIQPNLGLLNSLLKLIGQEQLIHPWLSDSATALWCAAGADIWKALGLYALLFYAGLAEVPQDVLEAAKVDGATKIQTITKIILPLIKSTFSMCLIFSLTGTLKVFESIYALTAGGPGTSTLMPTMYMYNSAFSYGEYGFGSSIAFFILMECLIITVIIGKLFSKDHTQ